eukprot:TRINITY_DN23169_c0_g1_i1.p1 TRINITY_DN23169_c0_g1~~TRINITY_DN23169_c0_g1_i1.p1  ORF type:complete len:218 (-),score=45.07 TRINITY_DN23169_c0_g1_i1:87-740(-)
MSRSLALSGENPETNIQKATKLQGAISVSTTAAAVEECGDHFEPSVGDLQELKFWTLMLDDGAALKFNECSQHLRWALGRCAELQQEAISLECADGRLLTDPLVSCEYALLAVSILARRDRAVKLLDELRNASNAENKTVADVAKQNMFSRWVADAAATVVTGCGGRVCMRDGIGGCDFISGSAGSNNRRPCGFMRSDTPVFNETFHRPPPAPTSVN